MLDSLRDYIHDLFAQEDDPLKFARENSLAQGLPNIQVPSHVGKLISLLTKLRAPKKALEIGLLGGYSTLWIAKSLPAGGKLISLEIEPKHADLARHHLANAGCEDKVEIRVGNAPDLLSAMVLNKEGPFDLIFIDADKENYPRYLEYANFLSTEGTLLIADNLLPKGEALDNPHPHNHEACAIYRFNRLLAQHPRFESILVPTIVGQSGRIGAIGIALAKS